MPYIIAHHDNFIYIERNSIIDYVFLRLIIYMQTRLEGISNYKRQRKNNYWWCLNITLFNVYEGVNEIHQYVDVNFVGAPLTMKMLFYESIKNDVHNRQFCIISDKQEVYLIVFNVLWNLYHLFYISLFFNF